MGALGRPLVAHGVALWVAGVAGVAVVAGAAFGGISVPFVWPA